MPEEELVDLKFRLYDGTDIGPIQYSAAATIAALKERIVSEWPRDKKIIPKSANDLKLINAGKVLENSKTVSQCKIPFGELPGGVITMHVVIQPSLTKAKTEKKIEELPKPTCCCQSLNITQCLDVYTSSFQSSRRWVSALLGDVPKPEASKRPNYTISRYHPQAT